MMENRNGGRVAWIFPGQGAQYSGMGKELRDSSELAEELFQEAEAFLPGISELCFSGTEEELKRTKNAQPTIFLVEMAAAAALREAGFRPDCTAGFSLGEWAAVSVSGLLAFEESFPLVIRRGELMEKAAEAVPAFMAAVLRLEREKVEELCSKFSQVYPVNFNCPGQISVAGSREEESAFLQTVKDAGGRAIPLKVSGGFHSPFMKAAGEEFRRELEKIEFCAYDKLSCPIYSDKTAQLYSGSPAELLSQQIVSPVQWENIIRNMIEAGVDTFVELGPGKTLSSMVQRILPEAVVLHVEDQQSLQDTVEYLGKKNLKR